MLVRKKRRVRRVGYRYDDDGRGDRLDLSSRGIKLPCRAGPPGGLPCCPAPLEFELPRPAIPSSPPSRAVQSNTDKHPLIRSPYIASAQQNTHIFRETAGNNTSSAWVSWNPGLLRHPSGAVPSMPSAALTRAMSCASLACPCSPRAAQTPFLSPSSSPPS